MSLSWNASPRDPAVFTQCRGPPGQPRVPGVARPAAPAVLLSIRQAERPVPRSLRSHRISGVSFTRHGARLCF